VDDAPQIDIEINEHEGEQRMATTTIETIKFVNDIDYVDDIDEYEPNAETLKAFEEIANRRNLTGPFRTVEALMESLLFEDDA
jgi:hypothetical protein